MKTIWKFPLAEKHSQEIEMPQGAQIMCVQMQAGTVCIWAMVHPNAEKECRTIEIYGSGHEIGDQRRVYLGTFQSGPFVFHVFERCF